MTSLQLAAPAAGGNVAKAKMILGTTAARSMNFSRWGLAERMPAFLDESTADS